MVDNKHNYILLIPSSYWSPNARALPLELNVTTQARSLSLSHHREVCWTGAKSTNLLGVVEGSGGGRDAD